MGVGVIKSQPSVMCVEGYVNACWVHVNTYVGEQGKDVRKRMGENVVDAFMCVSLHVHVCICQYLCASVHWGDQGWPVLCQQLNHHSWPKAATTVTCRSVQHTHTVGPHSILSCLWTHKVFIYYRKVWHRHSSTQSILYCMHSDHSRIRQPWNWQVQLHHLSISQNRDRPDTHAAVVTLTTEVCHKGYRMHAAFTRLFCFCHVSWWK